MNTRQKKKAVVSFVELIERNEPCSIFQLERALDQLASTTHFLKEPKLTKKEQDDERLDYQTVRLKIVEKFPQLGLYNVPEHVTEKIAETEVGVGDAIDDLADIYVDLKNVLWHWKHSSEERALWHLWFAFTFHLKPHLRDLQFCLSRF
jgi:hypothetical protein